MSAPQEAAHSIPVVWRTGCRAFPPLLAEPPSGVLGPGFCSGRVPPVPTPGRGHSSLTLSPVSGPLGTVDQTTRYGVGDGVMGQEHTWDVTLGRGRGREGSASALGSPLLASLLRLWEEARLPQNADLDEMVF